MYKEWIERVFVAQGRRRLYEIKKKHSKFGRHNILFLLMKCIEVVRVKLNEI